MTYVKAISNQESSMKTIIVHSLQVKKLKPREVQKLLLKIIALGCECIAIALVDDLTGFLFYPWCSMWLKQIKKTL